ncbi:MAG: 6-hydroxymethylpterin diphosphokinase MptE-like protein [Candidatus Aminicenantales bacterium]
MPLALRPKIKRVLPEPIWRVARDSWIALRHASAWPLATFHPWRRTSIQILADLKDSQRGKRAFILGNGPSLARTDVSKLKGEYTFGMNRVYLAFSDWGFSTSYFVCVNDLVIEQFAVDIAALKMPKFLSWHSRSFIKPDGNTAFLNSTYERPAFARDACGRLWEGATVTYVALQLAFHMGFDPVILIGVDHNFASKGTPNTMVVSEGADASHFDPRYFGAGYRWQLPDLEMNERAYHMARQVYESAGRQVLDATIDGKLTVFPKVEYNSLF